MLKCHALQGSLLNSRGIFCSLSSDGLKKHPHHPPPPPFFFQNESSVFLIVALRDGSLLTRFCAINPSEVTLSLMYRQKEIFIFLTCDATDPN